MTALSLRLNLGHMTPILAVATGFVLLEPARLAGCVHAPNVPVPAWYEILFEFYP